MNCGCKRPAVGPEPHSPVPLHGSGFFPNAIEFLKKQVDKLFRTSVFTVNGKEPVNGNVDVAGAGNVYTKAEVDEKVGKMQAKLTAGTNITIDPDTNVISATGGGGGGEGTVTSVNDVEPVGGNVTLRGTDIEMDSSRTTSLADAIDGAYGLASTANDAAQAAADAAAEKYTMPVGGIPADDLAAGVIPPEVTESTVSGWGFTKNAGTYVKPDGGIPADDLADSYVKTSGGTIKDGTLSVTTTGSGQGSSTLSKGKIYFTNGGGDTTAEVGLTGLKNSGYDDDTFEHYERTFYYPGETGTLATREYVSEQEFLTDGDLEDYVTEEEMAEALEPLNDGSLAGVNDYLLATPAESGDVYQMSRDAVNLVDCSGKTAVTVAFPEATGRCRDFVLVLKDVAAGTTVDCGTHTFVADDPDSVFDISAGGGYLVFSFTEVPGGDTFVVGRRDMEEL